MKTGIIIYSDDPETVWNAFRYGNFALKEGDEVKVFLTGRGVEAETIGTEKFPVSDQMEAFFKSGGTILACGTCLNLRGVAATDMCPLSTMKDMHRIVKESDRVLTF